MRTLELLAPAKNLECGIAAIDHGADAVYIGAPKFGARAAAGNSIEDIRQLCDYAHQFHAKVHVTVNTIVYDSEIRDTLQMIQQLQAAGVDALLLQDMGVLYALQGEGPLSTEGGWTELLHSSTQCDTRTADKVKWLQSLGFHRAVLARELSVSEIEAIHAAVPDMELEVFVHGALCVCYSGVCYASEYCFGRSANRGECAQFCRMKFDLLDADGQEIEHQRHLLSLKDMCQIDNLEALADAGACSFKIEGRLKDADYVKNVVAAYSQRLDDICRQRPGEYERPSLGRPRYAFEPNLKKTFNRGFTHYFLRGRQMDITSFDTPKAIGEYVGKVKELRGNSFNVASVASFANGDGLCFINDERELEGFRVNRAEGNRLFPLEMPRHLRPGVALYRNNDVAFSRILAGRTAERKIPVKIVFDLYDEDAVSGFSATAYYCKEQGKTPFVSGDTEQHASLEYMATEAVAFEHSMAKSRSARISSSNSASWAAPSMSAVRWRFAMQPTSISSPAVCLPTCAVLWCQPCRVPSQPRRHHKQRLPPTRHRPQRHGSRNTPSTAISTISPIRVPALSIRHTAWRSQAMLSSCATGQSGRRRFC